MVIPRAYTDPDKPRDTIFVARRGVIPQNRSYNDWDMSENSPWGGNGDKAGTEDGGNGGKPDGPRNPWDVPPSGQRSRGGRGPSAADVLADRLKRLGGGIPGMGGGGGGVDFPGGNGRLVRNLAILFLTIWVAFTSFHLINPQERGVVMRLGRYVRTLEPGVSMTLPAPFDRVRTVDVQNIRSIDIPSGAGEKLVLTHDENIIDLDYTVRWSIKDPALYLFELNKPDEAVEQVAESAMRAAVASVSFNDAIGSGRTGLEAEVATRMQTILDSYHSGVKIEGVAIKRADPPDKVNDAFKEVTAAQQAAITSTNQARAYAQQILAKAQGEAAAFDAVYAQYRLAPDVTRRRMYYETMEEVLAKTDKTVIEPGVTPYLALPGRRPPPVPAPDATTPGDGQ